MAKIKRQKVAPQVPRRRKRAEPPRGAWYRAFRARVDAILKRTKAARRTIDARLIGVDMTGLAHLEVVVFPRGKRKPPGLQRLMRGREDPEPVYDPNDQPARSPIAPPVPFTKNELAASGPAQLRGRSVSRAA